MHPWLVAILNLLGMGAGQPSDAVTFGGSVQRRTGRFARKVARASKSTSRRVARGSRRFSRIVRYSPMPTIAISRDTIHAHASDDRVYLFDMTFCPELAAGDTISSATITGDTSGLTIGTPAATSTALDGITAGYAVQCRIAGFTANTTLQLSAVVTLASGRKVVVPGTWSVAANY